MELKKAIEMCKDWFNNDGVGKPEAVAFNMVLNASEKYMCEDSVRKEKVPVRSYNVKMRCGCGGQYRRDLILTSTTHLSFPPEFEHKCDKCGRTKFFPLEYPRIVHEEIQEVKNHDWQP